jgi:hypothetical protein
LTILETYRCDLIMYIWSGNWKGKFNNWLSV